MEPQEVLSEIGQRLNEARIRRRLSIDELSFQLKIRREYLVALEQGDWQSLPEEVYAQGFLRSTARALDLDPNELVAMRRTALSTPEQPETQTAAPSPAESRRTRAHARSEKSERRSGTPLMMIGALAVIFIGLIWVISSRHRPQGTTSPSTSPPVAASTPPSSTHVASNPPKSSPPPTAKPKPVRFVGRIRTGTVWDSIYQVPSSPVRVTLAITGTCWLEAWSDGKVVNPGTTYNPGQRVTFIGNQSVDVLLGNSGGVHLSVGSQNLGSAGKDGAVNKFTFRTASSTPTPPSG